jgi:hypothetical protein
MILKSWNITGLPSKINSASFRNWVRDADVITLQETFLDSTALQVAGFVPVISCAKPAPAGKNHRATGGLVTLISSQVASVFRSSVVDLFEFEGFEGQCILFERCDKGRTDLPAQFLVINCYIVAHPAPFHFSGFFFAPDAFLLAFEIHTILAGDFNAHWKAACLPTARDRDFRDFVIRLEDSGYAFHPSSPRDLRSPTFVSGQGCSIIDYIFVKGVPASGYRHEVQTVFGHRALRISLDWPAEPRTSLSERTSYRKHFRCDPPTSFLSDFINGHSLYSHLDFMRKGVSCVFSLFVLTLGQLFQVSRGSVGALSEPWHRYLSQHELDPLRKLESEVFSLVAGAQLGEVPLGLSVRNSELNQLRRTLHSLATRRLLAGVRGSYNDPTRLWSFIRKFRVQNSQGSLPIDTLVTHFAAVFNQTTDPVPMVFCEREFAISDPVLDELFTVCELETAMKELDHGTAPGVTGIGNDILLDLFRLPDGPNFFLSMSNACFEGGCLPDLWRCTKIFLLYKGKGDVADPGSYRGIALMESMLKLYERLLFHRLSMWARSRGLIPDCQFGFRPRSSTLDAVFVFVVILFKYVVVQGSSLFVCLVDFQKAFPSVNRAQLLAKLEVLGVSTRFRRGVNSTFVGNTFSIRRVEGDLGIPSDDRPTGRQRFIPASLYFIHVRRSNLGFVPVFEY